jgi:L,D-peptidoglycan transpeptidase YkuD (ErfK/YbiS/YcfS/YnhG family)
MRPEDGWCDAPGDRNYNRPVRHPYPASAERLWREDELYDVVVVLGHNQRPRIRAGGSAIFMHVARPGYLPTEGCIALARRHLLIVLERLKPGSAVRVLRSR